MLTRFVPVFAVGVIAVSAVSLHSQGEPAQQDAQEWAPALPAVAFAGSYSAITEREYDHITDAKAWRELWTRHVGDRSERDSYGEIVAPAIDFEHFAVIAIFNGAAWNTRSMELIESAEQVGELQIRFDAATYQTASLDAGEPIVIKGDMTPEKIEEASRKQLEQGAKAREEAKATDPNYTRAYGIFVLPRTDKPIVLLENVQGIIGKPPKWKEQHRFDAVK